MIFVKLIIISVLWALAILNTELLIGWNHFADTSDPQSVWQFGQVSGPVSQFENTYPPRYLQVLPLFLLVLPFSGTLNAFKEHGLRKFPVGVKPGPEEWHKMA